METNIGIFLCDCGKSLKNIDFEILREKAGEFQDVVHVGLSSGLCLPEGQREMVSAISGSNVNRRNPQVGAKHVSSASPLLHRVVIAACSPLLKEPLFRRTIAEAAGAAKQVSSASPLLAIANIREQCSWAHAADMTAKALEMIRMAANRVRVLQPVDRQELEVNNAVLVAGGGFSGMISALEISRLGLKTTLVENGFDISSPQAPPAVDTTALAWKSGGLEGWKDGTLGLTPNIEILTEASVVKVEGSVGDFTVRIKNGDEEISRKFGAIIFAPDRRPGLPADFEHIPHIISQRESVQMIQNLAPLSNKPKTIAFVIDFSGESSRLATCSVLNKALAVKKSLGDAVYVFCKNLKVDSDGMEKLYREARKNGVVFLKFEEKPTIESCEDGRVKIDATDLLLGDEVTLFCDVLVVEDKAPQFPSGLSSGRIEAILSSRLKVGTDAQGFYQDENVHLYPVSSRRKGIFFVGNCRGDLDLNRTLMDASSAAMNAYELLSSGKVSVEVDKVKAEPDKCRTCLTCIRVCPHNAIGLVHMDEGGEIAQIYALACDECGICAAICPAKAIDFSGASDDPILAEIDALGKGNIIAFCCAESAYQAADNAGKLRIHSPSQIRVISLPCIGRVDVLHILKAIEFGATGVLVMGCQEGACRHLEGNIRARERVNHAQNLLKEVGMNGEKVKMVNLGPDMAWKFAQEISRMTESIEERQV